MERTVLTNERLMARTHPRRMAGHARHAPHVDTDRRQGAPGADAENQSLVERTALRQRARLDHVTHTVCRRRL